MVGQVFREHLQCGVCPPSTVKIRMMAMFLPTLFTFTLVTCREVVRDASGRVVQTIERQKQAVGSERAVIRDASGRITGTATTQASGSTTQTQYRDASGRSAGSATTHGYASGLSRTTYRDASGRVAGSSDTSKVAGSGSYTRFRDGSATSLAAKTLRAMAPRPPSGAMAADE